MKTSVPSRSHTAFFTLGMAGLRTGRNDQWGVSAADAARSQSETSATSRNGTGEIFNRAKNAAQASHHVHSVQRRSGIGSGSSACATARLVEPAVLPGGGAMPYEEDPPSNLPPVISRKRASKLAPSFTLRGKSPWRPSTSYSIFIASVFWLEFCRFNFI